MEFGPDIRVELPEFARDGFAAIERLGAELGSLFESNRGESAEDGTGAAESPSEGRAGQESTMEAHERSAASRQAPRSLAEIEAELRTRLMDEGIVVRGHDVARVIGLITGKTISWVD